MTPRLVALLGLLSTVPAHAGGMLIPVHGMRSLARGGAFIAGADDADALWQNPAGLAHAAGERRQALLFELAASYSPVEITTPDGARVSNQQPTQPLVAVAASLGIGERLVIAGGISTPALPLHRYANDSPARYASVSTTGSTLVQASVGVAYRVSDRLRVGATLSNLVSQLEWSVVMSGCPPTQTCAADDRSFDMPVTVEQTDYTAPGGSLGVQWDAAAMATVGASITAPQRVAGQGTLTATLPTNAAFAGGKITGNEVALAFTLPPTLRAGVELRPLAGLRIEAALAVELWSLHDEITIEPRDVSAADVQGGPYAFGRLSIARDYETTYAPSVGVEYHGPRFMVGAGYAYETGAAPARTVSALTVDAAKHLVSLGGGYEEDGWQIGAAVAYVAVADVTVADPAVPQLAPFSATTTRVNAGTYEASHVVGGVRFARRW